MAIRNGECFCEGKEMQENFLQESTGRDKVKIYKLFVLGQLGILISVTEIKLIF